MEKQYLIGTTFVVIIITVVVYYYYKKNKKEDSLLNKYLDSSFSKNKISTKFYVDPTPTPSIQTVISPTRPPVLKMSQKNIDVLKLIENSICESNKINWIIDPDTEVNLGTFRYTITDPDTGEILDRSYEIRQPYYIVKLVGLFKLIIDKYIKDNPNMSFNELYSKLSDEDKEKLVILSLIGWQTGGQIKDEDYKNYISIDENYQNFNIKNIDMLLEYKRLRTTDNYSEILNEIKEGQTILSREDFLKYNIIGIMSLFKDLKTFNIFSKDIVCAA